MARLYVVDARFRLVEQLKTQVRPKFERPRHQPVRLGAREDCVDRRTGRQAELADGSLPGAQGGRQWCCGEPRVVKQARCHGVPLHPVRREELQEFRLGRPAHGHAAEGGMGKQRCHAAPEVTLLQGNPP